MDTTPPPYLTTAEAAAYLKVSVSFLNKKRCTGGGPVFGKFGHAVRYMLGDLDTWADGRRFPHTSAYPDAPEPG